MSWCFGFMIETVLIMQRYFHYCWAVLTQCQSLSCLSPHHWVSWGCTGSCDGTQLGQLATSDHSDVPHHMVSCLAYKAGEKEGRGDIQSDGVLPSQFTTWWSLAFLALTAHRKQWMNCLFLFHSVQLLFSLLNCLYLSPFFSLLLFQFSLHPTGGSDLPAGVKPI